LTGDMPRLVITTRRHEYPVGVLEQARAALENWIGKGAAPAAGLLRSVTLVSRSSSLPTTWRRPRFASNRSVTELNACSDLNPPTRRRLDVTIYQSDQHRAVGHLSRQGPPALRWALYEAAQAARRPSSPDRPYYQQLAARIGGNRACIAIARKLLKRSYHVLRGLGDQALQPIPN
jgi:hypothetical protein